MNYSIADWLWATEAIPIPVTSLLPIVLFPLLDVTALSAATAPYASPIVYLFLGGFILATAIEKWDLHKRIALNVVAGIGKDTHRLILAFMLATALLSMWISNTATTLMMMPIAISVTGTLGRDAKVCAFATPLLLGVAYAASIGGLMTPIGSPPNLVALGFLRQTYDIDIGFGTWVALALPVGLLMLAIAWRVLVAGVFRVDRATGIAALELFRHERASLGPMTVQERRVIVVFGMVAAAWIFRPLLAKLPGLGSLSDPGIAIAGAVAMCMIPAGGKAKGEALLDWESAQTLPWGVILLFGGGLSLASAVGATGLAAWIGNNLSLIATGQFAVFLLCAVLLVLLITELTSNTATMATLAPVLGAITVAAGYSPVAIILPAALAVNGAFMMPVATPPNAIVFSSGRVSVQEMIRAGIWLNVIAAFLIASASLFAGPWLFPAG